MPYNKKILSHSRSRLEERRQKNILEHNRRLSEAYRRIPALPELDRELTGLWVGLAKAAVSGKGNTADAVSALRQRSLDLQMRRAELLVENGFPRDWLEELHTCPKCKDTGNDGTGLCSCLLEIYRRELTEEFSSLSFQGDESFERFDLSYYSDAFNPAWGCSPREYMAKVLQRAKSYAEDFSHASDNMLFCGDPGLGKTYLSACIARTVFEAGFTVYYDTAVSALSAFEKEQFARGSEEGTAAAEKVKLMLSSDLFILDDLGTEMPRPAASSALYTLVNSRLSASLPTLINTNLTPDELAARYPASVVSRIRGGYRMVTFVGDDIRLLRKK